MQDSCGNTAGSGIDGKLVIDIVDVDGAGDPPQFVGKARTVEFPMTKGQASVQVMYPVLSEALLLDCCQITM